MMKRLIVCLLAALVLTMGVFAVGSAAVEDNLKFEMDLSSETFTGPKEITISIKVSNTGDTDMPGPVTLYYPNGKTVEEFGSPTLTAGTSKTWSGTWNVTESQLQAGRITFKLKYSVMNDGGELVNMTKNYHMQINYTGAVAAVEINRTITPTTAREGQEVTVTYDVVNTGNVEVTDVSIKENKSISTKKGTIKSVPAGEKASYSFKVTMKKKDLTSEATITYKAGGKSHTEKKDAASIKYGEVKLNAALTSEKKGGFPGDKVKLTLTLKNTGNVDYQNVTVTDAVLGEVFAGLTVPAGQTLTQEKEVTIDKTADYQFTVKGNDASGGTVETATDRLTLTAMDPAKQVKLEVVANADRDTIYSIPGTVKFVVKVTNNSTVDVKDVNVSASGVQLYSFPTILSGETREFTRDVSVSMAGQYRFDATVVNQLSEKETFPSNIIRIGYAQPTAVPTEAPIVTPPMPVYEPPVTDDGLPEYVDTLQQGLGIAYWVCLTLAIVFLALLAVGVASRISKAVSSAKAQDHLERSGSRDYTRPAAKADSKDLEAETPEVEVRREEELVAADEGEMAEETIRQLYPSTAARMQLEPTVTVEEDPQPEGEEEPVYYAPQDPLPETLPEAEEPVARRRRSQRHQE